MAVVHAAQAASNVQPKAVPALPPNVYAQDASTFYVDFDKKAPAGPSGCYVHAPLGGGEMIHCHIDVPAQIAGVIDSVDYACNPGATPSKDSPCGHVFVCPDYGHCGKERLYAFEPNNYSAIPTRSLDFYAWQNDGNSAILRFTVHMRPR